MGTKRNNLSVCLPGHIVKEVKRAAEVRSHIEHTYVSADDIVRRALLDFLWLDEEEMKRGGIGKEGPPVRKLPPPGASFGALLRKLRKAAHKTVKELAAHLGVSLRFLHALERDHETEINPKLLHKIAAFLEVNVAELKTRAGA